MVCAGSEGLNCDDGPGRNDSGQEPGEIPNSEWVSQD